MAIHLSPASEKDAEQLFEWRNDPFLIERSTSKRVVEWAEHKAWFDSAIRDQSKRIFISHADGQKIGSVRFERNTPATCIISAYVMEEFTGNGYGVEVIKLACKMIRDVWPIDQVLAFVRTDNAAGSSGFKKAGFELAPENIDCPEDHLSLVLNLSHMDLPDWDADNKWNIEYYTEQTRIYGIDSRSLNWGSAESQQLRFRILSEVCALDGKSILDVGCGLGDLHGWLKSNNVNARYAGIDIVPEMVSIAQSRFDGVSFEVSNLLQDDPKPGMDVVMASGIFAKRTTEPKIFLQSMVSRMFEIAGSAVAFNSLSSWADEKEEGEFYADPIETMKFCRELTPWVTLRHDYHSRDFTIYLFKSRNI